MGSGEGGGFLLKDFIFSVKRESKLLAEGEVGRLGLEQRSLLGL